jgi:hypothetical protein
MASRDAAHGHEGVREIAARQRYAKQQGARKGAKELRCDLQDVLNAIHPP